MEKRLFDDAIGEVPPSSVDVDAVITRGRRADRLRRVANPAVAAGVAVLLAVGAIAYTMSGDGGGSGVRVGGGTTTPSAPSSSGPTTETKGSMATPPAQCARPGVETPAAVIARVTPVLGTLFQAQLPNVQLVANPVNQYPDGVLHGPLELFQVTGEAPVDMPVCHVDSYFLARATIQAPDGNGNTLILLAPSYDNGNFGTECDPVNGGEQTYCEVVTGPHGDHILKQTMVLQGGTTTNRVDIVRADGTSVIIESSDIGTDVKTGGAPSALTPPLTVDQLVTIGTDPALTLFP